MSGIKAATQDRVLYFDPTYILDQDVFLPCGKLLHKAGARVNPLEHMDLSRRLLFIDGREAQQISWLKEQLIPSHADKVYFDQAGELTSKFGIKASPAVVEQNGKVLKVQEIKIN